MDSLNGTIFSTFKRAFEQIIQSNDILKASSIIFNFSLGA